MTPCTRPEYTSRHRTDATQRAEGLVHLIRPERTSSRRPERGMLETRLNGLPLRARLVLRRPGGGVLDSARPTIGVQGRGWSVTV